MNYIAPLNAVLKAETASFGIEKLTGVKPYIKYSPAQTDIFFSKEQLPAARKNLNALFSRKAPPGEALNIHFMPVIAPMLIKQAAPVLLGALFLGIILGREIK